MIRTLFFACVLFLGVNLSAQATLPCQSSAHNQFDFWVGEWNVFHTQADTIVGQNQIRKTLNGCVIEEHWTGASGFEGKSFNTYNPADSTWNQVWVDVSGSTYHFTGKYTDNVMVMQGKTAFKGKSVLFDMSYTFDPEAGTVRQIWKSSGDAGANWKVIFDGIYRKKTE